jgi:hypothetical protein
LISVLLVNYLANALPLNGITTGAISDRYDSLITPAGPAFSIWGFIYLSLIYWITKACIGAFRKDETIIKESESLTILFPLNCLLNIGWLFAWHYGYITLSLFIMIGILLSLLGIYNTAVKFIKLNRFPFSMYLGWISVATIVNVSVVAIHNEIVLFPLEAYNTTLIMMVIATSLGLYMINIKNDMVYGLVIVWALSFIALKQIGIDLIAYTAFGLIAILIINILSTGWRIFNQKPQVETT